MTRPPHGPDDGNPGNGDGAGGGWDEPADHPRLYPVPALPGDVSPPAAAAPPQGTVAHVSPGAGTDPADLDGIPWGNSPQELLDEALRELDALTQQVGVLGQLIRADRVDQAGTGAGKHLRYRYERHPAGDAAAAHAELTRWVSWLVATYQLTDTVPPCWDRHDALAEELAGFYVAWQNVWADEGPWDAAAVWHEQLHSAVAARWPMWLRGARCSQTCALDTDFAQQTHHKWTQQAAAGGGADHRLTRTRQLAPPIPPPTKKTPARRKTPKAGGPTGTPTSTAPTTGRTRT